jgi:hypothetical protein
MGEIIKTLDTNLDIAIYALAGDVSYEDVRNTIEEYYNGKLTKYTVWDFSKVVLFNLITLSEVKLLERLVAEHSKKRPGCFDVLVVPDTFKYGLAKMYSAYAQVSFEQTHTVRTKIVRTLEEALNWITNDARSSSQ